MERVVAACASGQDVSALAASLAGRADVVAVILDFGEGAALEAVRDGALAAGALRAHVLDVRERFAAQYVLPALRAGALVAAGRDMPARLRQAITIEKLAEIAALERGARVEPPSAMQAGSSNGRSASAAAPAQVDLRFEHGVPAALNGVSMALVDLLDSLGTIARVHGFAGDPAWAVLQAAHDHLRHASASPDAIALCDDLRDRYVLLVDGGGWHSPVRAALDAFFASIDTSTDGIVHLRLHDGQATVDGVTSLDTA